METDRGNDRLPEPVRRAERLNLMTGLNGGVEHLGSGADQDRSVIQEHRGSALFGVAGKPFHDQIATRIDGRIEP